MRITTILSCILLLLAVSTPSALQAIENPVVDLGTGYAMEGSRVVDVHTSNSGDVLTIVGKVVGFKDPFSDLDPMDPTKEYTYVYSGLVSSGTAVSGSGSFIFYTTPYAGGELKIYCDTAQNADFANQSTFSDGDMILSADLSNTILETKSFNCAGNHNSDFVFTGGSLFNRVSDNGNGFTGIVTGLFSVCASAVEPDRQAEGYFGRSDTKMDVDPPVAVNPLRWGEIKKELRPGR
ncbi:MAG: hypothetical protein HKN21_05015 [Candidatus Eisenbacteria bacterium]|uniref:Uncharacterized protein n=1 Tax=Eiseniibacteriota bacterium TaxID=2212470 RepID=A0A7Y2E7I1_UNCEI|nr:hypothetical protein [Candidatus Eisenbacteria bacterium]